MIVGVRIDFRLIHGQVANLWATAENVSRFMVVDDEAAANDLQKQVLRMACPANIRLSVLSVEKAAENILAHRYDSQRVFIVVRGPKTAERLRAAGVTIDKLNVGNMAPKDAVKTVTRSISVSQDDIDCFKRMEADGVELYAQMVPSVAPEAFIPLLDRA